jgi:hypothetical protein
MRDPSPQQAWWRRSRFHLSVRAMMMSDLVLGLEFGWVVRRAHVQRDAVAAIERTGGRVSCDWDYQGFQHGRVARPLGRHI